MSNTKLTIGLVVVAVLSIIGVFSPRAGTIIKQVTSGNVGGITNYDSLALGQAPFSTTYVTADAISTALGVPFKNVPGSANLSGGATTTLFAVANPAGATSTCAVSIFGTNSSTTASFFIGTSTSLGLPFSQAAAAFISTSTVATSTQFYLRSGLTASAGQQAGGTSEITVGANENIVGVATTTTALNVGITGTTGNTATAGVVGGYSVRCIR